MSQTDDKRVQLIDALQNIPDLERERVLAEALASMSMDKENVVKQKEREAFWDLQLKTLCSKGYPDAVGVNEERFLSFVEPLKGRFLERDGEHNCIVIPPTLVSPVKKMTMVELDGKKGYSNLNPALLKNNKGVIRPNSPYLILNVEPGCFMRGISPTDCTTRFKQSSRHGFVTDEGIMVITYWPESLKYQDWHAIDCSDSCYGGGLVPCLEHWDDGPRLSAVFPDADSRYGSGSSGGIIS